MRLERRSEPLLPARPPPLSRPLGRRADALADAGGGPPLGRDPRGDPAGDRGAPGRPAHRRHHARRRGLASGRGLRRARGERRQPARPPAPRPLEGPRRARAVLRRGRGDRARGRELKPMPAQPGYHWRVWAAEAAGTALLVLAILLTVSLALGEGSPVADALPGGGPGFLVVGVLVAPCVALIAVSPLGRLSGAHLNPALTLGFWALGRVSRHDLAGYLSAQLLGGVAGALAGRLLLPADVTSSIGGTVTHPEVSTAGALALEAGMTALLIGV